jgi:hypothetical protein
MLHEPAEPASHTTYNNCLPATKADNICQDKEPEIKDEDFNDINLSNDLENFNLDDDHDFDECTFEDGPIENSILEESTFDDEENDVENEFESELDLDSKEFCFN